jgi:hypothetical protein
LHTAADVAQAHHECDEASLSVAEVARDGGAIFPSAPGVSYFVVPDNKVKVSFAGEQPHRVSDLRLSR